MEKRACVGARILGMSPDQRYLVFAFKAIRRLVSPLCFLSRKLIGEMFFQKQTATDIIGWFLGKKTIYWRCGKKVWFFDLRFLPCKLVASLRLKDDCLLITNFCGIRKSIRTNASNWPLNATIRVQNSKLVNGRNN